MGKFYGAVYKVLSGLVRRLYRVEIIGAENEPERGPFIVCANHISNHDVVILAACLKHQVRYLAKAELFRIPLLSQLIKAFGAYPLKRGQGDVGALKKTIKLLEDGEVVADVYVQDGEIVFVAVTDVTDGEPDEDEENQNADFDEVELAKNGNLTFYDDDGDQITLTGEHDWELWWLSASDWVRTGYGDDYVYGEDNPWKDEWDSGERYYVVIDGVESNIVTAD